MGRKRVYRMYRVYRVYRGATSELSLCNVTLIAGVLHCAPMCTLSTRVVGRRATNYVPYTAERKKVNKSECFYDKE